MSEDSKHSELAKQFADKQSSLVFPDTVRNEAEGYRTLLRVQSLSGVQRIGSLIFGLIWIILGIAMFVAGVLNPRLIRELTGSVGLALGMIVPSLAIVAAGLTFTLLGLKLLRRATRH